MKIGLSYSRCVRDIVDGKVDINDVLVLITRTDFDPRDNAQWKNIWDGYGGGRTAGSIWAAPEWSGYGPEHEETFRNISIELFDSGKMHQPRQFGAHPRRLPHIWLETILPSDALENEPSIKAAWEKFQMLASLSGIKLDDNYTV